MVTLWGAPTAMALHSELVAWASSPLNTFYAEVHPLPRLHDGEGPCGQAHRPVHSPWVQLTGGRLAAGGVVLAQVPPQHELGW